MSDSEEDAVSQAEINFFETVNRMICSRDPAEALAGRAGKMILPIWGKAFADVRDCKPADIVQVSVMIAAWCMASTVIIPVKNDKNALADIRKIVLDEFVSAFSARYNELAKIKLKMQGEL